MMNSTVVDYLRLMKEGGPSSSLLKGLTIESVVELLGAETAQRLIEDAPAGDQPIALPLEKLYGCEGGQGLALRIGRVVFYKILQQYGQESGLDSTAFRLLPAPRRLKKGLMLLSQIWSAHFGERVAVTEQDSYWWWRTEDCSLCQGHLDSDLCCYLLVGVLQELLSWAGGGRFYPVREAACRASGADACIFQIDLRPLD